MALSNWAVLALNHRSEPVDGSFVSPLGVRVEIYKNWLYVHDQKAWDGGSFVEPVVMQINRGDLIYRDISVVAARGEPIGDTEAGDGLYVVVTSGYGPERTWMVGCGVYGFSEDEWIGVTREQQLYLMALVKKELPDAFAKIDWAKALQVNKGDLFFAAKLGVDPQASPVGQPKEPHLMAMLRGGKEPVER